MYITQAQLKIDTNLHAGRSNHPILSPSPLSAGDTPYARLEKLRQVRLRSTSNASSASTPSVLSPGSESTNASTSSLLPPSTKGTTVNDSPSRASPSPSTPDMDGPPGDVVLALHDYFPQHQNATCLSFKTGQIIRVLNKDASGWWDGELEGRRGWFPSNYVSTDFSLQDEEEEDNTKLHRRAQSHAYSSSTASADSWASSTSREGEDEHDPPDSAFPPIMDPLVHGLSLLQNAVRSNRVTHFQPSTACIISCVRSVLSATDTLNREAPILQRSPPLLQERGKLLSCLASLVSQAKKASEENLNEDAQEIETSAMLRLGGQVFSHVRRFLAVAVQSGVDLPERRQQPNVSTAEIRTPLRRQPIMDSTTPTPKAQRPTTPKTPGSAMRAKSLGDLREARKQHMQQLLTTPKPPVPPPPPHRASHDSTSSLSSLESTPRSRPPFLEGPSPAARVMEMLRLTHDHYLSTIAAFIGHAHSHSRASHASSTGQMYELVREIVEMVCKLLTIVEAVLQHPDVPSNRLGNLRIAKEGLYSVTSSLAESVRLLTVALPPDRSEEQEKNELLRSATGALKAGADCVASVKMCLTRSVGERQFILNIPRLEDGSVRTAVAEYPGDVNLSSLTSPLSPLTPLTPSTPHDPTIRQELPLKPQTSDSGFNASATASPNIPAPLYIHKGPIDEEIGSPTLSYARTDDDGTTWEGSTRSLGGRDDDRGWPSDSFSIPPFSLQTQANGSSVAWMFLPSYPPDEIAYNSDGHIVGATLAALIEKMTPHDVVVDATFSSIFFLTFRLFCKPAEMVEQLISRYNILPPAGLSEDMSDIWQHRKGVPVRLRVSNFIKMWVESYWRPGVDDEALFPLVQFTKNALSLYFAVPARRILDLLEMRSRAHSSVSARGDRIRDPGMSLNPPAGVISEVPRPLMTKTLLNALRAKNFSQISITDFDTMELARQMTVMECQLYCAIKPEEVLETGQDGANPVNVRAMSSLSTLVTGWVSESILNEPDLKKRIALVKFFVKVADRCALLNNFSTPRSILAALDSSTISRLRQTWNGLPQKNKVQLEELRRIADHGRNYHQYRSRLRNTAPPAVPFLGLYLTDVTFCREGNPSTRKSPTNADKQLLNFNKYHKLARIVQDMQRFQVPYNLKEIPEVQEYLSAAFEHSKKQSDLQDLYRRSLAIEPKQSADVPPTNPGSNLFNWTSRTQPTAPPTA